MPLLFLITSGPLTASVTNDAGSPEQGLPVRFQMLLARRVVVHGRLELLDILR